MRVLKYYVENYVSKTTKKLFSLMSNLQTYYHFKLDFPKVDQHTYDNVLLLNEGDTVRDSVLQTLRVRVLLKKATLGIFVEF